MRRAEPRDVRRRGAVGCCDIDADAHPGEQPRDLLDIVAMAKSEGGRPDQVGGDLRRLLDRGRERAGDLVEGLVGAVILLALIARQLQRDHRHRQAHLFGHAAGIVLDELGGAGRADDHRLGLEPVIGRLAGGLEQVGRVRAQIAGLEGGVGHRRAVIAPLDHGEEQIGIGVALRRVQHVVQPLHRGGDAHRADMRRAFICPERELHGRPAGGASPPGVPESICGKMKGADHSAASLFRTARRLSGRAKSAARSPACS